MAGNPMQERCLAVRLGGGWILPEPDNVNPDAVIEPNMDVVLRAQYACVKAAKAWSHREDTPRETALARLTNAMALTERAAGKPVAEHPLAFLDVLRRPLTETLGSDTPAVTLLDGNAFTEDAAELEDELGDDPVAEDVEGRVKIAMHAFARQEDGADAYRRFRNFLITTPLTRPSVATGVLQGSGLNASDVYGPVSPTRTLERYDPKTKRDETLVFPCPACGYPMRVSGRHVHCTAHRCRTAGAQYELDDGALLPVGGADPVEAHAIGALDRALLEPFWRYVLIPGLTERELAQDLEALGATVTLWPHLDAYDLLVEHRGLRLQLDVKDWRSAPALIAHLRRRAMPGDGITYVIPEEQGDALPGFYRALRGITVMTTQQVLRRVREANRAA